MTSTGKRFRKRDAILAYLQNSCEHPSAETVYRDLKEQIPDLSIGTVYRNLNLFREQGLATCVATVRGSERFDATTAPHVHFICDHCGAVIDLHMVHVPPAFCDAAANACGGEVSGFCVNFAGRCQNCIPNAEHPLA